jgi:heme oxygenase
MPARILMRPPIPRRPPRQPRRDRLRTGTADAHRRLEHLLESAGCFASLDGYRRYLWRIAPLQAALEGALETAGAGALLPDWPRRRKASLILADLRALGGLPAPPLRPFPGLAGWRAGDALGALYVLEGATLGGAVLARRLGDLGLCRERGGRFLDPYGEERGRMWRLFLEALENTPLAPEQEGALLPRARAVFALFAEQVAAPLAEAEAAA